MNLKRPKLLVLYSEVMPYNVVCFRNFVEDTGGEMVVIGWDESKKLTPYRPPEIEGVSYRSLKEYPAPAIIALIDSFAPGALYVAGRMEKAYLRACLHARSKGITVIGTYDNQFDNSWKQWVMKSFSAILFKRYFNYMMVPGIRQYELMRYIGYERRQILFPQYCADTRLFTDYYEAHGEDTTKKDTILFVGRLNPVKGLDLLVEAFSELRKEDKTSLQLVIVGNGPMGDSLVTDDRVSVRGFLSQEEMVSLLPRVKFFCLPSREEPWGLVIHEFAAAGLPILTTHACGAATAFVKHGYNGLIISAGNKQQLKDAIVKMDNLTDQELKLFGHRSYELSKQISPYMWTSVIKSVMNNDQLPRG